MYVDEAVAGNDAVVRAEEFEKTVGADAVVLTKADMDPRGGAAISIAHTIGKPLMFLGTGQGYDDITPFSPDEVIGELFSEEVPMLDKLGNSLKDAMKKLAGRSVVDRAAVEELVKDLQRALLQSDVNVKLVMNLSNAIKKRSLEEELPKGMAVREHVLRIVYQELVKLMGKGTDVRLGSQTILMAGLQGSGKTTTTAKLARYFQRKGLRVGVICGDTFRPGAYSSFPPSALKSISPGPGNPKETDALKIVREGLPALSHVEVIIIDTQGRHALENDLIQEIIDINTIAKATHRWLVIDAALGQQASEQARRFHDAINIDGVIITKMDGTAKGGGALSAVSETQSGIVFIGSGETIDDLERFDPDGFISRLLGMGDLKALVEKAEETISSGDFDVNAMMRGKFTLRDMYKQARIAE